MQSSLGESFYRERSMTLFQSLAAITFALVSFSATAADTPAPQDGVWVARNFKFHTGEVMPELRLHYVTLGTPKRDPAGRVTNAVLLLHGTTGSGKGLINNYASQLFGEGQPLDAGTYYLIIPDSIGHGGSSKPSDGLRAKFPHYGYSDMVEAQHSLVTEGLGVDHLRLVLGGSMGGMHTLVWGEKYPDMMDALMSTACQPTQISGHNLLWRRLSAEAIRNDPEWNGGAYEKQLTRWVSIVPLFNMMLNSRARLYASAPDNAKSNELFDKMVDKGRKIYDANDYLYAFESSSDYDPEPDLGKIKARLLILNFADDMINAVEIGVVERVVAKIPNASSVIMPANDQSYGHLNHTHPEVWKAHLVELLKSLP